MQNDDLKVETAGEEAVHDAASGGADAGAPAHDEAAHHEARKGKGMGRKEKAAAAQLEEITRARDEAEQARLAMQDRLLRLQADFENFRKRTLREKSDLFRMANEDLMSELLPVLDHFDLALGAAAKGDASDAIAQGVRMVREQLSGVLSRFGLQALESADQAFDPSVHEAISQLPSETIPENGIIAQARRGYKLGEKLLRPAQVVVSSGPAVAAVPPVPEAPAVDAPAAED